MLKGSVIDLVKRLLYRDEASGVTVDIKKGFAGAKGCNIASDGHEIILIHHPEVIAYQRRYSMRGERVSVSWSLPQRPSSFAVNFPFALSSDPLCPHAAARKRHVFHKITARDCRLLVSILPS